MCIRDRYYGQHFRNFIGSVDMCKLNKYDTPDLVYGRYDGTIIKRLISAFSFRPTLVSTLPIYPSPIVNTNPYQQNITPMVTSVSMINIKLPPVINDTTPIDLNDSLQSNQFFLENGVVTPRSTSIIYSRGVLFFYVDRRTNIIKAQDMQPFNISKLPISISGFERLNDRSVIFKTEFNIRDDVYQLRSVVLSEVNNSTIEKNLVIGSSAIFMIHPDNVNTFVEEYFIYDPIKVTDKVISSNGNFFTNRNPVRVIQANHNHEELSFNDMAGKRGIIFMYELKNDESKGNINM
jgi:hypothetical protein